MKKRYWSLIVFVLLFVTCRMEFLSFRKNDDEQKTYIREKAGFNAQLLHYESFGKKINYNKVGNDSLPLVVFVHGAPGSSSAFLDYLSDTSLLTHALLVAPDRPGYGYSDFGKAESRLQEQSALLKPILEKHRRTKAILVGHSFGGPVIAKMAMDYPDLVDGLVIVAGSVDPVSEPETWWRRPLDWKILNWMLPPAFRVCNEEILPLKSELVKMLPDWKNITCPVTVIQGETDELVPVENAHFLDQQLINSKNKNILILKNQGHFILWTRQKLVVEEIKKLL